MRDSVRVHKALVDSLGVKKLQAVAGASGGSIQAMEWAVNYPDFVERVIHVIAPGFSVSPWVIGLLDGVAQALKLVTLTARHWGWAERSFGYKLADENKKPGDLRTNLFLIEDTLQKAGMGRARTTDANNKIYMAKANQIYNVEGEIGRIKARILFVPAASDLVFPPEFAQKAAEKFRAQGGKAEVFVIEGDGGHLDGVLNVAKAGETIRGFMAR